MPLQLGKKQYVPDSRDLRFADFKKPKITLPKVPTTFGHEKGLQWGMLGNGPDDTVTPGFNGAGDCVFAAAAHETQLWLNEAGVPSPRFLFNGQTTISDYSAVTGYQVGQDWTDNGTEIREALKYRQKTGILDTKGNRHRIGAYLALDPHNHKDVLLAMYLFGACEIGFAFPDSAWDQLGQKWTVVPGAQIEGGHDVPLVARRSGGWRCVTWGANQYMSVAFYDQYVDEAWCLISPESLKLTTGRTYEGFNLQDLNDALDSMR